MKYRAFGLLFHFFYIFSGLGVSPLHNQPIGLDQWGISELLIVDGISTEINGWHQPHQHLIYDQQHWTLYLADWNR